MVEQSAGGEDDWVKQMLAEAMLGRSTLPPTVDAAPVESDEDAPADEPEVRYQVVLDEPVEAPKAPTAEDATDRIADHSTDGTTDHATDHAAPTQEAEDAMSTVVDPAALKEEFGDPIEADEGPAPASTSRLFERPNFDATNDPGVEDMLADEQSPQPDLETSAERSRMRGAAEWLVVLGSAVVVALLLRAFLFQAFFIPSESMEETLRVDDRVLVNKLSYRFGDVERGEVVVFRRPENQPGEFRDLIKRVIGLPGESIEARDNTIFIDGQVLIEPYLIPGEVIGDFGPIVIPEGEYFMMGDNRDNSGDSRVFGTIDSDRIIGRAFFLFWPLDRVGSL